MKNLQSKYANIDKFIKELEAINKNDTGISLEYKGQILETIARDTGIDINVRLDNEELLERLKGQLDFSKLDEFKRDDLTKEDYEYLLKDEGILFLAKNSKSINKTDTLKDVLSDMEKVLKKGFEDYSLSKKDGYSYINNIAIIEENKEKIIQELNKYDSKVLDHFKYDLEYTKINNIPEDPKVYRDNFEEINRFDNFYKELIDSIELAKKENEINDLSFEDRENDAEYQATFKEPEYQDNLLIDEALSLDYKKDLKNLISDLSLNDKTYNRTIQEHYELLTISLNKYEYLSENFKRLDDVIVNEKPIKDNEYLRESRALFEEANIAIRDNGINLISNPASTSDILKSLSELDNPFWNDAIARNDKADKETLSIIANSNNTELYTLAHLMTNDDASIASIAANKIYNLEETFNYENMARDRANELSDTLNNDNFDKWVMKEFQEKQSFIAIINNLDITKDNDGNVIDVKRKDGLSFDEFENELSKKLTDKTEKINEAREQKEEESNDRDM